MIELWNDSVIFRMITIMVPFMGLVIWAFLYLIKSNNRIIDGYEEVKKELLDADTKEAFLKAWEHAVEWNKSCWHKNHSAMTMELKGMIEIKKQIYGID